MDSDDSAGRTVPVIVILMLINAVLLCALYVSLQRQMNRMQQIDAETLQAVEAREAVSDLLQVHQDLATAQRGYGLLGEARFRQAFETSLRLEQPAMDRVLQAAAPLSRINGELPALVEASRDRIAFSRMIVANVDSGRAGVARAEMAKGRGTAAMERLRTHLARMDSEIRAQIAYSKARKAQAKADIDLTLHAILAFLGVTVVAATAASIQAIRGQASRIERQDSFANAVIDPILVLDRTGTILFSNQAAERQFGYGVNELNGSSVGVLLAEWPAEAHIAQGFDRLLKSSPESGIVRDYLFRRRNGTRFRGNVSVGVAREGGEFRFVAVVRSHVGRPGAGRAEASARSPSAKAYPLDLLDGIRAQASTGSDAYRTRQSTAP